MHKNAKHEVDKIKAHRRKLIAPFESEFLQKWHEWKESDLTNQASINLKEQRYEEIFRKMLPFYLGKLI
jgi:hypothetical protein